MSSKWTQSALGFSLLYVLVLTPVVAQNKDGSKAFSLPTRAGADKAADSVMAHASQMSQKHGSHLQPILAKIGATPQQRESITMIVMTHKPKLEPLRQEYKIKSQEFLDFIITGKPDDVIMSRQTELNQLYSTIVTQYSQMRIEIRKHLTPDQCVKFEEYRRAQGWASSH